MNLDELQSAQSRERQTDSLQQLRESFYEEAGRFIRQLREERERAAERADDPFDAPEVRRLTDDIKTAERTVEAIYERRIGKLVKQASLEAAGMAADASGLTREEQDVFGRLVGAIEENRVRVLDDVLGDGQPADGAADDAARIQESASPSPPPEGDAPRDEPHGEDGAGPEDGTGRSLGVSAADVMGSGAESRSPDAVPSDDAESPLPPDDPPEESARSPVEQGGEDPTPPEASSAADETATDGSPDDTSPPTERTTVRITADVGEILGVDERAYDLRTEDVVTLPTPNARPLLQRDAAEKLD
ncbi:DNA replication complex subunit Gins51 [Halomarina pelagica]|uniref:DNA replication complex subunit Gins51 n=1 Tax=Halomarina pelagica TaxID=2961599 RepID=UPI0020C55492|nr:hypothetical protein [Halomarina sp. BND7]